MGTKKRWGVLALAWMLLLQTGGLALLTSNYDAPAQGAPIAKELDVTTYRDIAYAGTFVAMDAQGDDITYTVDTAPQKGMVEVDGASFVYTPKEGKTGSDRFTYVATDSQGNASAPATVLVEIAKIKTDVSYIDTTQVEGAAAQHLAETGVFVGSRIGETYYFEPERTVSRSAFLAMAMEVAEIQVEPVDLTCFCDDQALDAMAKGYVSTAVMAGYVQGVPTQEGMAFQGEDTITMSQASAMLSRVLELEDVDLSVWYPEDTSNHWANQAVGNLEAADVLAVGSFGSADLEQPLTRGQAAVMLSSAKRYLQEQESGVFDWLW